MQNKIVIGNWKMNPATTKEAEKILADINKNFPKIKNTKVVICPPPIFLSKIEEKNKNKKLFLGSQNAFYEELGAFTGEFSAKMLQNLGVKYVILGHSERREFLGEENSLINKKIKAVLSSELTPVFCFGEKERDEGHNYLNFIKNQIEEGLNGISKNFISKIIFAYEPVWAIGKNAIKEANSEEFREISVFLKRILSDKFGPKSIEDITIIYGGSVHSENCLKFLTEGGANGFLVGRDSLNPKKFLEIISITDTV